MSRNTLNLLLLTLLACNRYETGIDRTVIQGTLHLVPAETTEAETEQGANESVDLAEDLGFIGYRVARLHGTTLDYGADISTGKVNGDWDYYRFSPLQEGTLALTLSYAGPVEVDTADLPKDDTVYAVQILDLDTLDEAGDPTVLFEGDTKGYYGLFTTELAVSAKGHYAIGVGGSKNTSDDNSYEIRIDGFDPNGTQFLVGAYQEADFAAHGNPVGGTSVDSFEYDESTYTWSGDFEVLYIREVITCSNDDVDCLATQGRRVVAAADDTGADTAADTGGDTGETLDTSAPTDTADTDPGDTGETTDTGATGETGGDTSDSAVPGDDTSSGDDSATTDEDTGGTGDTAAEDPGVTTYVNEAIPTVYLFAGTFSSLNAGILAGTHFSSQGVAIQLSTDDAETDLHKDVSIDIDQIQPLLVGWQSTETEPNDVALDVTTYNLVGDLDAANVLPVGTGLGYVDFLSGTLVYTSDDPEWGDDSDVFAFTVDETVAATFTLAWANAADDLDLHFYDSSGTLIAAGWYINNSDPELFGTGDFGFTLEPGETYYIAVLGYYGAAGDHDWTLSVEYTTP